VVTYDKVATETPPPAPALLPITAVDVTADGDVSDSTPGVYTLQFSADVLTAQGSADNQNVTWSVSPATSGVSINSSGLLTVAYNAADTSFTVKATSAEDTSIDGVNNSNYTLLGIYRDVIKQKSPGQTFTDPASGVLWRLLNTDASGNKLIITDAVYGYSQPYNNANTFTDYATGEPIIKGSMNNWYASNAGKLADIDKAWAVANLPIENPGMSSGWSETVFNDIDWVYSLTNSAGLNDAAGTTGVVFPLSVSDVAEYGTAGTGVLNNIAYDIDPNYSTSARIWWLRSPGSNATIVSNVTTTGSVTYVNATSTSRGFRPALWIQP
jgi:hypothetical protein